MVTFMLTMMGTMSSSTSLVGAIESDPMGSEKFPHQDLWEFLLKLGPA